MLARALLAAWMLDLAVLAAFLKSDIAVLCIAAAIAIALATGIFLEIRQRWQGQIGVSRAVILPMIFLHLAFLSAAICMMFLPAPAFAIDRFVLYQVEPFPDGTARFASLSEPLPDGQRFVSAIDVLVLLQVRNRSSEPQRIQDYRMAGLFDSGWQPLCRVALAPNAPYYLPARSSAREVVLTPLALEAADGAIAPGQATTFWSAWTCPQKCNLAPARLRLGVRDSNARSKTVAFPSRGKAFDMPSGVAIGGILDLDPAKTTIYGRNRCTSFPRRHRANALW